MEIRAFSEQILSSPKLEDKLRPPAGELTDAHPGPVWRPEFPARTSDLTMAAGRAAPAMPSPGALSEPIKRGRAHHIMANHELQAVEVMAWVLCAFPTAAGEFRRGLVHIIQDEQRHTRMHIERARSLGVEFGEFAVNGYIWKQTARYDRLEDYLAGLPLTFEGRNLDHTIEFERYFAGAGDPKSAAIMRAIHRDEIEHVRFGIEWLRRLIPAGQSDWDAYVNHLHWPLHPAKAVGDDFQRESRLAAGLTPEFLDRLQQSAANHDPSSPRPGV